MNESINNCKVLLIISKQFNNKLEKTFDFSIKNSYINFSNYTIEYIVDPSRQELERKIIENEYLCIIPCTTFCVKKIEAGILQTYSYNVCELLQKNNIDYFGNKYITNLILNDKISYLKTSEYGLPSQICTRYNFFHNYQFETLLESSSCILEPIFYKDCISSEKYIVNATDSISETILRIFTTQTKAEEIMLYKYFPHEHEIIVSVIGNPPYSNTLIYTSDNLQKENISLADLLIESHRLFEIYSLKDFAQFKYLYSQSENKFYLSEINSNDCINKYVMESTKEKYNLDFEATINLILVTYLSRQTLTNESRLLISKLIHSLPEELTNNILPLDLKRLLNIQIDYRHICKEISNNILKPDESNKYRVTTQLHRALDHLPKLTHIESPFLGVKNDYEFLDNYRNLPQYPQDSQKMLNVSVNILNGQMRWHSPTMLNNIDPPIMLNTVVASAITNLYNPCTMEQSSSAGYLKMEKQIVQQMSALVGWCADDTAGVFTSGGKNCLMYAIKSGLNRCLRKTKAKFSPVVITSDINHYSIETVCYQLGMKKNDCIRIPITSNGMMDFDVLEKIVLEKLVKGIPIACVIFSGGNTTHCFAENIKKGVDILKKLTETVKPNYLPYVYYDLVVCWPWLFFNQYDIKSNHLKIPEYVLKKIQTVINMIKYAHLADGVGIDFHKLGFSPLPNSLFMSKKSNDLYSLMENNIDPDLREPYHYTFCNSRGATHIISAWNVLQTVGVQGFQSYIANMLVVTETIGKELEKYNFEIIRKNESFGFATILWMSFNPQKRSFDAFVYENDDVVLKNNQYLYRFTEYLKENHNPGYFLRFLPNYKISKIGTKIAAISIFPTTLNLDEKKAKIIAKGIADVKHRFDEQYSTLCSKQYEKIPEEVPK